MGENFSLWKLKMKVILRKDGCLAAINERPVDFADDIKWNEIDGNAMANFHLALADEVLSNIEEKKTAKEILDHLIKLYEATSLHNKIFLNRKLYTLRMPESTSVTEHLNTLNTLFSQLTSLSCKIGEQERAELLLQSLPDSYDQLIINLTNSNVTSLVFDDIAAAVLQEENRSKNKEDIQKDCWSLNKNSNPQDNTKNTSDDGDALCCEASTTVEGRKRFADIWLIDSGATYHMTSRREWFHHYELVSGGSVYSCNDYALEIVGVGTIKLKMYDGTIKVVRDVRHVKALVVLKGEKIAANLYMLKGETLLEAEASVASSSSDFAMLWHKKLGHMSEQGMKVLVEQKLLPGLTKVSLTLCEHCITSKQHRLKFNTSNSRGKSVLELVHSDVWQAPVTSLGGEKYFVSFIDDYAGDVGIDNGGEYTSEEFDDFCKKEGIKRQFTVANTPQQNGVAERMNRTLLERTRAMLRDAGLEKSFWAEAVNTACYLVNRAPSTAIELKTPMEMWTGKPVDYSNLHVFGSIVYVMYNAQEISKLDPKSRKCKFLEDKLQRKEDDDSAEKSETTQIHVEKDFEEGDSSEAEPAHDEQEPESSEAPTTRQSDRMRRRPNWHSDYVIEGNIVYCLLTEDGEPSTYQEAINSSDASLWMMAMQEEIEALHKNNTWDIVLLPKGMKPIEQLDVKTTFLHGNLEEELYMLQPEGFEEDEKKNLVCRLNKSLYGLKQASRYWYKRFDSFIMCLGYNILNADPCAYFKRSGDNDFVILLLTWDQQTILGMQIHRDRSTRKIWLSQKNYLKKILSRFNMQDYKPISTPLPINFKLSSSMSPSTEEERMKMSRVPYASAVGSLMFAMICTRPDIAQAVGVVSWYMANPDKENWNTVKRILRYIKGTSNVALCYGGSNLLINGYVDSDYAGDLDKSKSTTGYVFKVAGGAVSCVLKLQSVVATSTTEAEYVAATQASKEAIWLKMLLEELGHNQEYVSLFCDSQSALHLVRNPTFHSRTKHIRVQYHFIRENVEEGTIDMQKIHTKDNIADFMTKAINADKFTWCRSSCGLSETEIGQACEKESKRAEKKERIINDGDDQVINVDYRVGDNTCVLHHISPWQKQKQVEQSKIQNLMPASSRNPRVASRRRNHRLHFLCLLRPPRELHQPSSPHVNISLVLTLYGNVFKSHIFGTPTIVSTDAEVNRFVLQSDARAFVPFYPKSLTELMGESSILLINGSLQRKIHGLIGSFFKSPNLKHQITRDMQTYVQQAMNKWRDDKPIFIQDETKTIAFKVLVKALISMNPGEEMEVLKKQFQQFISGLMSLPVKAKMSMVKIVHRIIQSRRNSSTSPMVPRDVVDVLLMDSSELLTDDLIAGNMIDMMIPGEDSVPVLMTLAIRYLSDCPAALHQLTEENLKLKRLKAQNGEPLIWNDYLSLFFTQSVITETPRMGNVIIGVMRGHERH
ncbi:Retrovirus-related Pol polyprotein from transposon TNT 1-94 [Hibiscus syriacus]|uniref:Retrovirus-related Pol polyprotein from transposon TNT 1-94 n=1 Tax=Hibiscus syriacus TaxID=106335 RepID=A0A6A2WD75_HIBSY|nr:Retrovirus-related Pol polyprotein from transposon TNT 1-94 [Hibiscus syriacus]